MKSDYGHFFLFVSSLYFIQALPSEDGITHIQG